MSLVIYLMGIVDNLATVMTMTTVVLFIFTLVCLIGMIVSVFVAGAALDPKAEHISSDERMGLIMREKAWSGLRKAIVPLIVLCLLSIAIPSSKTLAAMYIIPKIMGNQKLETMVGTSADLINAQLSNWVAQVSSTVPVPAPAKPKEKK